VFLSKSWLNVSCTCTQENLFPTPCTLTSRQRKTVFPEDKEHKCPSRRTNEYLRERIQMDRHILSLIYFIFDCNIESKASLSKTAASFTTTANHRYHQWVQSYNLFSPWSHWRARRLGVLMTSTKIPPSFPYISIDLSARPLFEPHHDHLEIFSSLFLSPFISHPFLFKHMIEY